MYRLSSITTSVILLLNIFMPFAPVIKLPYKLQRFNGENRKTGLTIISQGKDCKMIFIHGLSAEFTGSRLYFQHFERFDAEYSCDFIKKYNSGRDNAYNAEKIKEHRDIFSFKPYIVWRKKAENERKAFDGLGICLKYNI